MYLCIHWLILVRALTGERTSNHGISGWCFNQLSYPARAGKGKLYKRLGEHKICARLLSTAPGIQQVHISISSPGGKRALAKVLTMGPQASAGHSHQVLVSDLAQLHEVWLQAVHALINLPVVQGLCP